MSLRLVLAGVLALAACQSPRSAPANTQQKNPQTPVAKIGGGVITSAELDKKIEGELSRAEQEYQKSVYQMRRQALEQMIQERLVESKAKAENLSKEDLIKRDVVDKVKEPADADAKALYDDVVKRNPGRQVPPFEQLKPEIVQHLKTQEFQKLGASYITQLKSEQKVEVLLPAYEAPRVQVAATGPSRGGPDAKVTVIEFSDFQCPACVAAEPVVKQVLAQYGDKVRFVYRDFPLPMHPQAPKASEAAQCAGDQNKYWEMHDRIFAAGGKKLEVQDLKGYAKEVGLDTAKFDACLDSGEKAAVVKMHLDAGEQAGVKATPSFFVNGRLYEGMLPPDEFKRIIDEELAATEKTAQK